MISKSPLALEFFSAFREGFKKFTKMRLVTLGAEGVCLNLLENAVTE